MRKEKCDMRMKTEGLEAYASFDATKRIWFLCENYTVMEPMIRNFRERLIDEVADQKYDSHHAKDEGLGVRIQVAFCRQNDPTYNQAVNRNEIAKAIDDGYLDECFFEGTSNREELIRKVSSYHFAKREYGQLSKALKEMNPKDRAVILPFMRKEKSIYDLAEDMQITYKAVQKKLKRIKNKLEESVVV